MFGDLFFRQELGLAGNGFSVAVHDPVSGTFASPCPMISLVIVRMATADEYGICTAVDLCEECYAVYFVLITHGLSLLNLCDDVSTVDVVHGAVFIDGRTTCVPLAREHVFYAVFYGVVYEP
jgi:hypothetical protein